MGIFDIFKKDENDDDLENEKPTKNSKEIIYSPMLGQKLDIKECIDKVFSTEIVGKGCLIVPSLGKVYSPCDGKISLLADSLHAIGISSKSGAEILIHIGIDTVELKGEGFTSHVEIYDEVKKGDLLMDFDIEKIKEAGKSLQSPIIITNTDEFDVKVLESDLEVSNTDPVLEVIAK
ncbi:PTS glucose transporter subunit IIA [Anaerococcus sp. Marseille-P9784]|uniref:PTS sugar transporter subunit IIA n=1 Tax=Anaerococcus sp. Marseille-P9784 TaxID=2614127 RepID=UPI001249BFAB|nr:PTS glucose transporter subunit IIA [Anaerococcus sp. Marseille-P9784]